MTDTEDTTLNHLLHLPQVIQHNILTNSCLHCTAVGKYGRRPLNPAVRELCLRALARRIVLAEAKSYIRFWSCDIIHRFFCAASFEQPNPIYFGCGAAHQEAINDYGSDYYRKSPAADGAGDSA